LKSKDQRLLIGDRLPYNPGTEWRRWTHVNCLRSRWGQSKLALLPCVAKWAFFSGTTGTVGTLRVPLTLLRPFLALSTTPSRLEESSGPRFLLFACRISPPGDGKPRLRERVPSTLPYPTLQHPPPVGHGSSTTKEKRRKRNVGSYKPTHPCPAIVSVLR
jgi:hypothetical protein